MSWSRRRTSVAMPGGVLPVPEASDAVVIEDPWGIGPPRVIERGTQPNAVPPVGRYAAVDATIAVGAALADRWCTVAVLGQWAGGRPLARLWRAERVAPEGDGFVVVFTDDVVLTVTGVRGLDVVRSAGAVSLDVDGVTSAVLHAPDGVARGSFETRGGRVVDLASGQPARWANGPAVAGGGIRGGVERRVAAQVGRGRGPRVRLVAVLTGE